MKTTLLSLLLLMTAFNVYAQVSIIGNPIKSTLKSQVCYLSSDDDRTCSGIRLSRDYILTAQHCVRDQEGRKKNLSIECEGNQEVEQIFESQEYARWYASSEFEKGYDGKSHIDFAVIKLKNGKGGNVTAKLTEDFAEFKTLFLDSNQPNLRFAKKMTCEIHGFGEDRRKRMGKLNSSEISTAVSYREKEYFVEVIEKSEITHSIVSPMLPESDHRENWVYSTLRPGDSGGPMFCYSESQGWIISGVASLLRFGECPEEMQYPKRSFFESKLSCAFNEWGMPSKATLEQLLGVKLP